MLGQGSGAAAPDHGRNPGRPRRHPRGSGGRSRPGEGRVRRGRAAAPSPSGAGSAPDAAERSLWQGRLGEARRLEELQKQLGARLSIGHVSVPELVLRDRILPVVELSPADGEGTFRAIWSGGPEKLSWGRLEPGAFVSTALRILGDPAPEQRLALGIYCLRARRWGDAKVLLGSLDGTALKQAAAPFLRELEAVPAAERQEGTGP